MSRTILNLLINNLFIFINRKIIIILCNLFLRYKETLFRSLSILFFI